MTVTELNGETHQIDSRTSDAVALALRFNSPIYTYEEILEKAGIILDDQKSKLTNKIESKVKSKPSMKESVKSSESDLKRLSEKALNNKLKIALEKEDYELAASLRDELNRRNPHK